MAIFGEIGKRITQTTQSAVKGTKDLADISRLNSQVGDEQKLLNSFYMQIGKKYYESNPEPDDEAYSKLCESISESMAKLTELRDEIQKIKGIKKCPGCGAEIPIATNFCGVCGYDTNKAPDSDGKALKCPNCEKVFSEKMAFCTDCGQKIQGG